MPGDVITNRRHQFGAAMLATAICASSAVYADTSTIGRTWPIVEPDALNEIEGRAGKVPEMRKAFGARADWSAMRAATLADASRSQTRQVVPFYTLDREIRLPDGRLLYARGYTFNPLAYVSLPQRLIVVRPRDLVWALREAKPADFVLLAAAGTSEHTSADPITLGERYGRPLFLLEERVKARLGLTVAPVVVRQIGQKLELSEVGPEDRSSSREHAR